MLDATALDEIAEIAMKAGAALLELYGKPVTGKQKSDGSPVTAADLVANAIILERLSGLFPGIHIVSEERQSTHVTASTAGRFFLVDPLDGTKEFLSGNGEFTVNIALVEGVEPTAGVVYAPAQGTIYSGLKGHGARRAAANGNRIRWREIRAAPAHHPLRIVASRSHLDAETSLLIERCPQHTLVSAGSSLKFCLVAAGDADLYPRMGRTMEWDTAAGDAILRAAGGSVRTLDGATLKYNKRVTSDNCPLANPRFLAAGKFDAFDGVVVAKAALPSWSP